jgi:hypothetical protein
MKDKSLVLMHKRTGQLFELFCGWLGWVVAWDEPDESKVINADSPLMFEEDKKLNWADYEILGVL